MAKKGFAAPEEDSKGLALVVLGIVAIIGVIALVLLFSGAKKSTGKVFALPAEDYSEPQSLLPSGYSKIGYAEWNPQPEIKNWIGYCSGSGYGAGYYEYQKPEPISQCDEYWVRLSQGATCTLNPGMQCPREGVLRN